MKGQLVLTDNSIEGILRLTLNRPDKRNALSIALLEELTGLIAETSARVLILRGAGPGFCAGLDLDEASDPSLAHRSAQCVAHLLKTLYSSSAMTIAAVHGSAMAGGAGILAACDLTVATPDTRIGFPETRRGLVAALVMTVLNRRISGGHLNELLLLAEPVDAVRAHEIGLVTRLTTVELLESTALEMARCILKGAPAAVRRTKQLMQSLQPRSLEDDLKRALEVHREARAGDEAAEGIKAFLERRPPSWQ